MTIEKKLLATNPVSGEVLPEAVSFDGATDYLLRTSDMTNNADGKTFTFSCWVYWTDESSSTVFTTTNAFHVLLDTGGNNELHVTAKNSSGTKIFDVKLVNGSSHAISKNTWSHLLLSIDLANTSNRFVYINDVLFSSVWVTYTNDTIDFTSTKHAVGGYINTVNGSVQANFKGRLAHVFLDYTYRDLSVTANRRLFIDADGKPSSTIPSNPILYLPMTDADTAGSNSGTGGDFTVNGILATAERGPNQDNCSASTFDGSNDYMRRTSLTGAADGKQFTVSFNFLEPVTSGNRPIFSIGAGSNQVFFARFANAGGGKSYLTFSAYQAGAPTTVVATFAVPSAAYRQATKTQNSVQISVDVTDTSKRHVYINGVALPDSWTTYTNASMDFTGDKYSIGVTAFDNAFYNGSMGEVYFNTAYIDLATDNPFWDSDTNRPNSVRKVIADTSVTPLIALPIIGNDAGNNLGSGGDFTVNSGPYTGARGGSEFWARSASFNGSTQYLRRNNITGLSDSTDVTAVVSFTVDSLTHDGGIISLGEVIGDSSKGFNIRQVNGDIDLQVTFDAAGIAVVTENVLRTGSWFTCLYGTRSGKTSIYLYKDGALVSSRTNTNTYTATDITTSQNYIGRFQNEFEHDGLIGCVWFDTTYIDFTQEINRNKFMSPLGYPANLGVDGSIPTGNQPLIFLNNNIHLGTNLGSGGNYTAYNSPTAGADVTP
mgnify:CR=1 FL=1